MQEAPCLWRRRFEAQPDPHSLLSQSKLDHLRNEVIPLRHILWVRTCGLPTQVPLALLAPWRCPFQRWAQWQWAGDVKLTPVGVWTRQKSANATTRALSSPPWDPQFKEQPDGLSIPQWPKERHWAWPGWGVPFSTFPLGYRTQIKRLLGEVDSDTVLLQETRKLSDKQSNLHLKQLEKEEQTKLKVSRRKEIIKIRVKINEIETKNNRKGWWNEKLVLWKDKQNW